MSQAAGPLRLPLGDTPLHIEGQGKDCVLMLHGWPDTEDLWDATVAVLRGQWRCARLTLPGFDPADPGRGAPRSLDDICALLATAAEAASPGRPVTLLLHDWGCVFGYEFAQRHPDKVARVIGVDVGDHNSAALQRALLARQKAAVMGYQVWLALAWQLRALGLAGPGDRMTRRMARSLRWRGPLPRCHSGMNYPYAMAWFGAAGGLRGARPVRQLTQPLLYLYGQRKPFMFHSPEWLAQLAASPGSAVLPLRTGHWVMVDAPGPFHAAVLAWLQGRPLPPQT